jgi:hypothetical protein
VTTHTIPLAVLLRATTALKIAKECPVTAPLTGDNWISVSRAYSELNSHMEMVLRNQTVELTTEP